MKKNLFATYFVAMFVCVFSTFFTSCTENNGKSDTNDPETYAAVVLEDDNLFFNMELDSELKKCAVEADIDSFVVVVPYCGGPSTYRLIVK